MKTKKELNALKEKAKSVNEEMRELTDEELRQVTGGNPDCAVAHVVPIGYDYNENIDKCPVCGFNMLPIAVGKIACTIDPKFVLTANFHVNHGGKQIEKWVVSSNDNS